MTSEENNTSSNEKILNHPLNKEMKTSYINYAMSVIIGRALPDARDGLKPVHRRVLYGMYDGGHTSDIAISKRLQHLGDSNTFMDFPAADKINFQAGGVDMGLFVASLNGSRTRGPRNITLRFS